MVIKEITIIDGKAEIVSEIGRKSQNLDYYFSLDYLNRIVRTQLNRETAVGNDYMNYGRLINNQNEIVKSINQDVINDTYKFTSYKEKLLIKNRFSNPRCISIPTIKDRICLRALNDFLQHRLILNKYQLQKMPHDHVSNIQKRIKDYDYYIKLDLKKFYDNIPHSLLIEKLKSIIQDKNVINLIDKAIKNKTGDFISNTEIGIPQGIPISNILAHFFLLDLDLEYSNKNLAYFRYVDDILIFCNSKDKDHIEQEITDKLINQYKLKLNHDKKEAGKLDDLTEIKPLNFLGYTFFKRDNVYITGIKLESKIAMESKIISIINMFKKTKNAKLARHELERIISGSVSKKLGKNTARIKKYGWLFFYSQITDKKVLWQLDALIKKQIKQLKKQPKVYKNVDDLVPQKKFVKAYYEIKYNFSKSKYFFKPDEYSRKERKAFVRDILDYKIKHLSNKEIDKIFKNYVYNKLKKDKKDLLDDPIARYYVYVF